MKNLTISSITLLLISCLTCCNSRDDAPVESSTISEEARMIESTFVHGDETFPQPDDNEGWLKIWNKAENSTKEESSEVIEKLGATVTKLELGGIPVLDIKPKNWKDNGKVLIYVHGGAYTLLSASSTLTGSVPVADLTGLRIISVDYTVAPRAKWDETTSQVVSVIEALVAEDYGLKDIAIYGDSAGGGLAAGSILKARDEGVGLIAAVVLWSPWSDITETGDTYTTLKDIDPILTYSNVLENAAGAYADLEDQKHPYVSPVYGDYSKGFPPTLIQVGTKEIFLSNAIRHYQALDQAGITVKLDPYEGMWHDFMAFQWQLPESKTVRRKMAEFLREHLEN